MTLLSRPELEQWLTSTYTLEGFEGVKLVRSHTNDDYEISTSSKRYILKIYGHNWRTENDIRYEVALIEHLAHKSLRVAQVIAGISGQHVYTMPTPKGHQFSVLFEYAEGKKPQPPFSTDLYVAFGHSIAEMHSLSDDFATKYNRKPLDLSAIIESPIKLALPLIKNDDDRIFLREIAQTITRKMDALPISDLDWGPIHGDATLDNLHVTDDNQIVLYDFDSGGLGWRAADLQGWAYHNEPYAQKWEAFKQGYASVRQLRPLDLEAAPYLAVAWMIWGLQIDLEQRILGQGDAKIAEYFAMQIGSIRNQAQLALG